MPWEDKPTSDLMRHFAYAEVTTEETSRPTGDFRTKICDEGRQEIIGILAARVEQGEDVTHLLPRFAEIRQKDSLPTVRERAAEIIKITIDRPDLSFDKRLRLVRQVLPRLSQRSNSLPRQTTRG
jgi:hypothetical protein